MRTPTGFPNYCRPLANVDYGKRKNGRSRRKDNGIRLRSTNVGPWGSTWIRKDWRLIYDYHFVNLSHWQQRSYQLSYKPQLSFGRRSLVDHQCHSEVYNDYWDWVFTAEETMMLWMIGYVSNSNCVKETWKNKTSGFNWIRTQILWNTFAAL